MEVLLFMRYLKKNKVLGVLLALLLSGTLTACQSPDSTNAHGSAVRPLYSLTREDSRTQPRSPTDVSLGDVREELLITDAGDYVLSGRLSGGVHVNAEDQVVHLFLNGVEIKAVKGPAIYVESAGKVIVTVCAGTENELSDGGSHATKDTDACFFSMNDLTVNGTGCRIGIQRHQNHQVRQGQKGQRGNHRFGTFGHRGRIRHLLREKRVHGGKQRLCQGHSGKHPCRGRNQHRRRVPAQ